MIQRSIEGDGESNFQAAVDGGENAGVLTTFHPPKPPGLGDPGRGGGSLRAPRLVDGRPADLACQAPGDRGGKGWGGAAGRAREAWRRSPPTFTTAGEDLQPGGPVAQLLSVDW